MTKKRIKNVKNTNAKFYNLAKPVMGIEPISTAWKTVMITITPHRLKK